jgi:hypothetical protein
VGFLQTLLLLEDRYAAFMLYGMTFSTCFNGYDAGIMTIIFVDKQFISYYNVDASRSGIIATIPWATTGKHFPILLARVNADFAQSVRATVYRWFPGELGGQTLGLAHIRPDYDHRSVSSTPGAL